MSNGIMPRGTRQLLLPASPWFIWFSLICALVFNMVQNFWLWGRHGWAPDILIVVLVFWNIHQPQRVGMGAAFLLGLIMDVHQTSLLGQHAICYTLLSFTAISLHRRILWFKTPTQALQLLLLFGAVHALELLFRTLFGASWPDPSFVLAPVFEALLWPLVSIFLLLPQRRTPDPDATRPL